MIGVDRTTRRQVLQRCVAVVSLALTIGCGACVSAGPVLADDQLGGTYAVTSTADSPSVWTIESSCTPSCVAIVKSSQGWRGYATLQDGRWTMTVYLGQWMRSAYPADPATCPGDADNAPLTRTWSWDAATLAGSVESVRGDQCGGSRAIEHSPVALTSAT
jgi:hypothetical protein